jgi:Flp pilus assembly protein TadG
MKSVKLLVSTFAVGLIFALTGTMAAQNAKTTFDGGIAWYNACDNNQSIVNAPGSTEINYQQNNTQATVHVLFHNSTTDGSYKLNFEANQSYNAIASTYDLPFHSVWAGPGGSFTMTGTLRVAVDASGIPMSSSMLWDEDHPVTTLCIQ